VRQNTAKEKTKNTGGTGIKPIRLAKSRFRSSVTNGRRILPKIVDGRSLWCRRARDLMALFLSDLQNASQAELAILRRAVTLIIQLEQIETKFAQGNDQLYLLNAYQRASNSLRRLLESLGLQQRRQQRDVTPSLSEYLDAKAEPAE
jgi:hypothetical protein